MTSRLVFDCILITAAALGVITSPTSPAFAEPGSPLLTDGSLTPAYLAQASQEGASVPAPDSDGLGDTRQRSSSIDCSVAPVWPSPVTVEGTQAWLLWWDNCPSIWAKGGFHALIPSILPPSNCTAHRLPERDVSTLWCTQCANPDPIEFFECMRTNIFQFIGPNNIGGGRGQMNCNDISAIYTSVAGYCPRLEVEMECGSFDDPTQPTGQQGHCWNKSKIWTPEGDLCFLHDITNNIVVLVACPEVHSPVNPQYR